MSGQRRQQRTYDHRLRELVRETGDPSVATSLGVPRFTAAGWLRARPQDVISLDLLDLRERQLQAEVLKLRRRIRALGSVVSLLLALLRVSGFRLEAKPLSPGPTRAALTELQFSNSLSEAFWRQAKHQWLFLNTLDSVAAVRRHMSTYVAAHNGQIPHSAFRGQTSDEMYLGTGEQVPGKLAAANEAARAARLHVNRALGCEECSQSDIAAGAPGGVAA